MKNYFIGFVLTSLSLSSFAQGESHVGEIRYSILNRAQFRNLYGQEWDLMQGQEIEETSELLPLWGRRNIPDARGVFLRCSNAGRDKSKGNADGDLGVGTYQDDLLKSHSHPMISTYQNKQVSEGLAAPTGHPFLGNGANGQASGPLYIAGPVGGSETRPRCITANAFIKLKEVASGAAPAVDPAQQVIGHPEFREAVETIVRDMMNLGDRR